MDQVKVYGNYYDTLSTMLKKKCMNTTLTEIGKKAGITVSYLSDMKSGRRIPSMDVTLKSLARVFEIPHNLLCNICEVERLIEKQGSIKKSLENLQARGII